MGRPKGSGLNTELILDRIEEELGDAKLSGLSMAEIAKSLKIKPPSLYSHFESLEDIKDKVTSRALRLLAEDLQAAIEEKSGRAKLMAFMTAYRKYAHQHPLLFDATQFGIKRENQFIMSEAHKIVLLAIESLEHWKISDAQIIHAVRIVRSLLNGFISLELQGGFQRTERPDSSFNELIKFVESGLKAF